MVAVILVSLLLSAEAVMKAANQAASVKSKVEHRLRFLY